MSTAKSTKSANTAATLFSEKFAKEMEKFFSWAQEQGYVIQSAKTGTEKKWKLDLLKSFEEPGRNKLEAFLRELMKTYVIRKDDEDVDDYKVMVKEFKDTKPKRKRTESTSSAGSTNDVCVVDSKLDTSGTYYLDTLDFTTEQLEMRMGKPVKTGGKDASFRWEWKVSIGDNVYSIYDWKNEAGEFDDYQETEWYMAGGKSNAKDKALFKAWILGEIQTPKASPKKTTKAKASKPKKQKQVDEESSEFEEVQESDKEKIDDEEQVGGKLSKEMEHELFGDTSDLEEETESLEIDLDDLEDDS